MACTHLRWVGPSVASREFLREVRGFVGWAVPTIPGAVARFGGHGPPYRISFSYELAGQHTSIASQKSVRIPRQGGSIAGRSGFVSRREPAVSTAGTRLRDFWGRLTQLAKSAASDFDEG